MVGETVFLWLVLCLDGAACKSAQVYQMDSFTGPAAMSDCQKGFHQVNTRFIKSAPPGSRLGCKTVSAFNREGLES